LLRLGWRNLELAEIPSRGQSTNRPGDLPAIDPIGSTIPACRAHEDTELVDKLVD